MACKFMSKWAYFITILPLWYIPAFHSIEDLNCHTLAWILLYFTIWCFVVLHFFNWFFLWFATIILRNKRWRFSWRRRFKVDLKVLRLVNINVWRLNACSHNKEWFLHSENTNMAPQRITRLLSVRIWSLSKERPLKKDDLKASTS